MQAGARCRRCCEGKRTTKLDIEDPDLLQEYLLVKLVVGCIDGCWPSLPSLPPPTGPAQPASATAIAVDICAAVTVAAAARVRPWWRNGVCSNWTGGR